MSTSNVRNIESLEDLRAGLIRFADRGEKSLQEIRIFVQRAETHFSHDLPAYWRRQTELAERELTEAKEVLAQKRATVRPSDRAPATEEAQRVNKAQRRIRECQAKQVEAKRWGLEMSQQCDGVLGPLADVAEHCEVLLPVAARELRTLIDQLRLYAERAKGDAP